MQPVVAVYRRPESALRQFITIVFILVLLAAAAGLRFWPVEPAMAAEGPSVPAFEWGMFSRHTGEYLIDPNDLEAAREHVKPSSGYGVFFDGCAALTAEMETEEWVTHTFTVTGASLPEPVQSSATSFRRMIPPKLGGGFEPVACEDLTSSVELPLGPYSVTLSIETASGVTGTSAPQQILVKDILIISVGDSYGSGEGAPDREVQFGLFGFPVAPAEWQDRRCHRSAWAGASQAAAIIEDNDPHTSVTFISLACSGATINTLIDDNPDDGTTNMAKYQGAGLLTGYSGIEHDGSYNPATFLPPQMEQAARIAKDRDIDALTISGGGNDMHFATVIADCVTSKCSTNETTAARMAADFIKLPERYNELARFIKNDESRNFDVAPRLRITSDRVFITEYPDPTRDMQGNWCEANQIDDPLLALPGLGITRFEMEWASNNVVRPLNQAIEANARKHGWNYVSGIAAEFFNGGHGWCSLGVDQYGAPNNWINRSLQALAMQGPVTIPLGLIVTIGIAGLVLAPLGWPLLLTALASGALLNEVKGTAGTMHPNRMGQMVYARHIAAAVTNRLNGHLPQPGDSSGPVIAPMSDIALMTLNQRGVEVYYAPPATTDNFDRPGRASCSPRSGVRYPIGTTRVTCNAKDSSGNAAAPVSFNVTITLALVEMTPPGPGSNGLYGLCGDDPANAIEASEDAAGVSYDSAALEGSSSGATLKARATSDGAGECFIQVGYSDIVTIEAGTTGLPQGAPVLVSLTLALDGTFSVTPGDTTAFARVDASYGVGWIDCDFEEHGFNCWYAPVSLSVNGSLSATGGASMTWEGYGDWNLREGEGTTADGFATPSCVSECGTSIELPYDIGSHTIFLESTVGAQFSVGGDLRVSASSASGGFAEADFSNTFASSGIQPAPGYEGLSFSYASGSGGTPEENEPPTVDAGGPYSVDEGGSVTLAAMGNDPDGDVLTYAWDLNNDGTFETAGATPTFSAASLDGPASRTIAVRVSDGALTATDQATVEVRNLAPSATISGAPGTLVAGTPLTLTGSASDHGTGDTFTFTWSVTNDGAALASGDGEQFDFTPGEAGHHVATLTVTDDDGATGMATVEFDVEPASSSAPVVTLGDDAVLHRGETLASGGSFSDPDADAWTATVDYGDGTGVQPLTLNADKTFSLTHAYTSAGTFTLTVCVSDDAGGQGCDTLAVSVSAYAIFAGRDDCGSGSADAIQWSGSQGVLYGDLHSNSGLKVSGSKNTGNGSASYRCQVKVSGSQNTFTSGPTKVVDALPWPAQLDAAAFACDVNVSGKLDLSQDGAWWVDGTKSSQQLAPLTICAGEITLGDSNISGIVTLVAERISLSGSNIQLTAHQHGVLLYATGADKEASKLSGSNSQLSGDLVARAGGIDLSGSGIRIHGSLSGWTVKLSGSNWTIDARVTPTP